MRKLTLATCAVAIVLAVVASAQPYVVHSNHITCGHARFDVLAPDLIRMQYTTGLFVDVPTAVVKNRSMASKKFQVKSDHGWLYVTTDRTKLRYLIGSGRFTSENLFVGYQSPDGYREWRFGLPDPENLGGPVSSFNAIIDQTKPENALPPLPPGFLSRSGCWMLDDSHTPVWNTPTEWIEPRKDKQAEDWYLFVYGTDYEEFFQRYMQLTGRIPMIPRYALGAWITDWNFEYNGQKVSENDIFSTIKRFRQDKIPLDVFVLDFGWHKYGWGGSLDWSPVVPDPKAFLTQMHEAGVRVSVNDHPSSGLDPRDSRAAAARKALGLPSPAERLFVDLSNSWRLKADPNDAGKAAGWQNPKYDDSKWRPVKPGPWEYQGLPNYDGLGWYRAHVDMPAGWKGKSVYISFGGVDDEYDLYVNGKFVRHWGGPGNSVYNQRTTTDITSFMTVPGPNVIALRVLDWGNFGGILKPSLLASDPRLHDENIYFNLADKRAADVYMKYHDELVDQGINFWWIDGEYAQMDGLNGQMWTNRVYYDSQQQHTGQRSFIFSRYGGPGSHRYPAFFTADCYSTWKTLAYEVPYTVKSGNVLVPYVTNDIGGFIGTLKNNFELYARWLQFGALSPILRLHSASENPGSGNVRLPWTFGAKGVAMAQRFFQLRYSLIPYLYTYCRQAYDTGMPLCRGLYLEYPNEPEAYRQPEEYMLGHELLVAPITTPGVDGVATRSVWFPPGEWVDWFTHKTYAGGKTVDYSCPLDRMPLFVRAGSILPMQPDVTHNTDAPVDPLILDVWPGAAATFSVYEDDGLSLGYTENHFRRTPVQLAGTGNDWRVTIGVPQGEYKGMAARKQYEVRFHADHKPARVTVNGAAQNATWDATNGVATVMVPAGGNAPIVVAFSG